MAEGEGDAWFREGACFLVQDGRTFKRNSPLACDLCRKRRVKCTVFEEGAPCSSCRNRDASCIVGVDEYPPQTSEQTIIFQPILPPPRVPCSSPIPFASSPPSLNLASLVKALKEPTPRPPPLAWKSPGETFTPSPRKKRARSTSIMNAQSPPPDPVFFPKSRPSLSKSPSPSKKKKPRLESKPETRSTPSPPRPPAPPPDLRALNTAVYDHKLQSLLRCAEWMARTTDELPKVESVQRRRLTFPTSDTRTPLNDSDSLPSFPLPLSPTPPRISHYSLPLVPPSSSSTAFSHTSPFRFSLPRVQTDNSPSSSSSSSIDPKLRRSSIESNISLISNTTTIDSEPRETDEGTGKVGVEWWKIDSAPHNEGEKKEVDQSKWKAISLVIV